MRPLLRGLWQLGLPPALALGGWVSAAAAEVEPAVPALQPSTTLQSVPSGEHVRGRPLILRADELRVRPDLDAVAEGHVEFRRVGTVIRADRLSYDAATDLAVARGSVFVGRDGVNYRGPELHLQLERFEGYFLSPEFEFLTLGSGGHADRLDFLDSSRMQAQRAVYSSCPRDGDGEPDWLMRADRVKLDIDANEGIAEGGSLLFLGVPVLALPVLSFPLSDDRKSGWLPPTVVPLDSRNGFTLGVPYYWNIAPNRDATFTPTVYSRLGLALDTEFRYLESSDSGRINLNLLPHDRIAGRARTAWRFEHEGTLRGGLAYRANLLHVSDNDYWKDFTDVVPTVSPRLLPLQLQAQQRFDTRLGATELYARVQHWQVLQTGSGSDLIEAPYQRSPQLGLQLKPGLPLGLRGTLETELNHFTRPDGSASAALPTGWRWHALGQITRPWSDGSAWITPRLSFNNAHYRLDQPGLARRSASRTVPSASVDAGLVLERDTVWFGRAQRQTLEPRLLYVNTPFRAQADLPNFDSAERDFNTVSIFADNAFTGVDRVSDSHQVTAGVITRLVDAASGAETLRLGLAQRLRLRDQRVVLGTEPQSSGVSDVLVDATTAVFNPWKFDAALQYNPDSQRVVRSILGARYSPGPFRTLSLGYRLARGLSEQLELGWQWPVYHGQTRPVGASGGCGGTLYAVGRLNYSLRDTRYTDAIAGVEYDAGCWVGRVVAKRLSTGRSEASTQLLLQIEFVGLSRLGPSPLQVLKDNIPGYRLLREPRGAATPNLEP
jgi:LPS-assembly protein